MRLEVLIVPVADVDRAKTFHEKVGFHLDVDHRPNDHFRVVQFTPPGSDCSVTFGTGLGDVSAAPIRGMHLVVRDIGAAMPNWPGVGSTPTRSVIWVPMDGEMDPIRSIASTPAIRGSGSRCRIDS